MNINEAMKEAVNEAHSNADNHFQDGGPFGAVILKDGQIIGRGHNTVIKDHDPTAHAEVNAIRDAAKNLGTNDLKGTVLVTSCEPCPMCLAATIWANISEVYYGATRHDAEVVGFRDALIYDYLEGKRADILPLKQVDPELAKQIFTEFKNTSDKKMY